MIFFTLSGELRSETKIYKFIKKKKKILKAHSFNDSLKRLAVYQR